MIKKSHVTNNFLSLKTLAMLDKIPLTGSKTIPLTIIRIKMIKRGKNATTARISAKYICRHIQALSENIWLSRKAILTVEAILRANLILDNDIKKFMPTRTFAPIVISNQYVKSCGLKFTEFVVVVVVVL